MRLKVTLAIGLAFFLAGCSVPSTDPNDSTPSLDAQEKYELWYPIADDNGVPGHVDTYVLTSKAPGGTDYGRGNFPLTHNNIQGDDWGPFVADGPSKGFAKGTPAVYHFEYDCGYAADVTFRFNLTADSSLVGEAELVDHYSANGLVEAQPRFVNMTLLVDEIPQGAQLAMSFGYRGCEFFTWGRRGAWTPSLTLGADHPLPEVD